jgi:hypothetical protein
MRRRQSNGDKKLKISRVDMPIIELLKAAEIHQRQRPQASNGADDVEGAPKALLKCRTILLVTCQRGRNRMKMRTASSSGA